MQTCQMGSPGPMLSKKVFLAGEPNFSPPPVHAARADVRDHVESQEGDHGASYVSDRGFQEGRQTNTVFREISRAAQYSTFSTASTISRNHCSAVILALRGYSITSSARPSSVIGTVIPSAFAVLRLRISSTLVACCT